MAEIKVRNLSEVTIERLGDLARQKGMSRESYIRMELETLALAPELKQVEDKYVTLANTILEVIERNNNVIEKNNFIMDEIMKGL